jgi:hypothetical protein
MKTIAFTISSQKRIAIRRMEVWHNTLAQPQSAVGGAGDNRNDLETAVVLVYRGALPYGK